MFPIGDLRRERWLERSPILIITILLWGFYAVVTYTSFDGARATAHLLSAVFLSLFTALAVEKLQAKKRHKEHGESAGKLNPNKS